MHIDSQYVYDVIKQGRGTTKKSGLTRRWFWPSFLFSSSFVLFMIALIIDDLSSFRVRLPDTFSFVSCLLFFLNPKPFGFVYICDTVLFVFQLDNRHHDPTLLSLV